MNRKLKLAFVLFLLGFTGVLSLLWMEFPLPEGTREIVSLHFSEWQLKALLLVNPTLFLIAAVVLGTLAYEKAQLPLPIFYALVFKKKMPGLYPLIIIGMGGGLFAGLLITISHLVFQPYLPVEYIELSRTFDLPFLTRVLYGGITEEIIMRFGCMSFLVWILSLLSNSHSNLVYWTAIVLSSLIFGLLHLPLAFALIPSPTSALISYIIIANALGGLVFGWLYWKKGLAVAMLAHIVTHLVMLAAQI